MKQTWNKQEMLLIKWFRGKLDKNELPQEEFHLEHYRIVTEPRRFYEMLLVDIEAGPTGVRAWYGALLQDLKCLFFVVEKDFKSKISKTTTV